MPSWVASTRAYSRSGGRAAKAGSSFAPVVSRMRPSCRASQVAAASASGRQTLLSGRALAGRLHRHRGTPAALAAARRLALTFSA